MKIFSIVILLVGSVLVFRFLIGDVGKPCEEGALQTWMSDVNFRCKDGVWVTEEKSEEEMLAIEKEMAFQAKALKAEREKRLVEREIFCGKGNVDENFRSLPCKDYSLVPDENLK